LSARSALSSLGLVPLRSLRREREDADVIRGETGAVGEACPVQVVPAMAATEASSEE